MPSGDPWLPTPMPTFSWREARVEGHPVRYQVAGAGEPVVLVHGLAASHQCWVRVAPAMARSYRTYVVDLPGFGTARQYPGGFVLGRAAEWLLRWMESVGLPSAHLVGHSMGGYLCLHLASLRAAAIRRLVLVAPAGVPAGRSALGYLVPLLRGARYTTPRLLAQAAHDVWSAGPRTLWRATRDLLALDAREHLPSISAPTLLVWGEHDALVPPTVGSLMRAAMPAARLRVLPGASHVPMMDQPDLFAAIVLAFLTGQPLGEPAAAAEPRPLGTRAAASSDR